jgi:multiple sugar transport system permease protein
MTGPAGPAPVGPAAPTGASAAAQVVAAPSQHMSANLVGDRSRSLRRTVAYALLIAYSLLMFIPFAWQVITSFKTDRDALQLTLIPQPFTLQGWQTGFLTLDPGIPQLFFNSVLIAGLVTLSNLVLASMAGYAFARLRFPLREVLFLAVLGTLMIPDQLRFVPVYLIERQLGLITRNPINYIGVVLILAVEAQQLFLMRQYFMSMPRDLEEAAKIDGAGHVTTFLRVMLPLAGPALAAVSILAFQGAWNGFFWPLLILQSQDHWTLPLGLFSFKDQFLTQWPALMSVTVAAIMPILLMYIFFQRYFVASVATTGVKG